jgi:hypothetical protein
MVLRYPSVSAPQDGEDLLTHLARDALLAPLPQNAVREPYQHPPSKRNPELP